MSICEEPDFSQLDDSALISMREEMRGELERLPLHSLGHVELAARYELTTGETRPRGVVQAELGDNMLYDTRARLLAVEVLLAEPETLGNDALETDLYQLREQLTGTDDELAAPLRPE